MGYEPGEDERSFVDVFPVDISNVSGKSNINDCVVDVTDNDTWCPSLRVIYS